MLNLSFPFLLAGSKLRPTDTRENILSQSRDDLQTANRGTFHLERAHLNIFSSVSFRRPFLVNYFSLLNQMDPETSDWVLNSCSAIYNCLSPFCAHNTKENFVSSCHKTSKLKTININAFITVWNDKIVALEKTTWFHFCLMKTGFLFLLQTICGDLGITKELPTGCWLVGCLIQNVINASPRIRLHASIRLKSEKRKIIKCKVANEKRSRQN